MMQGNGVRLREVGTACAAAAGRIMQRSRPRDIFFPLLVQLLLRGMILFFWLLHSNEFGRFLRSLAASFGNETAQASLF